MTKHTTAAVLGASGYTGGELLRYLSGHPSIDVVWASADSNAGRLVSEVFGPVSGYGDLRLQETEAGAVPDVDVAFLALPHGAAAQTGDALLARGMRVVDLSADWRLRDASAYDEWYGWAHPQPASLGTWAYGLTELRRDEVAAARGVANPGCYPSAAVLALAPALGAGALHPDGIVVDALSGISGAGRKVDAGFLFTELDASVSAYRVGRHQHTPEIEQELSDAAGRAVQVVFTPHLVPMTRGILATCYARMTSGVEQVRSALESAYKAEPFVHVLSDGAQPATARVRGTNHVLIGVAADERTGTAIVTSAIDNLGKGAAGQAVQNANAMLGLPETAGLEAKAMHP